MEEVQKKAAGRKGGGKDGFEARDPRIALTAFHRTRWFQSTQEPPKAAVGGLPGSLAF